MLAIRNAIDVLLHGVSEAARRVMFDAMYGRPIEQPALERVRDELRACHSKLVAVP